ncbi:MarR family winged helix-turn-helix transcriptional regulator [Streptomyces sp. NPDC014889]|uniref:MarR family winged helix-turn-helix transcriptional regulator n=1 Tax=Streptomyces sp. NPDC014889 TaxID=3364928 RepID=UPI0036FBF7DF
MPSSARMPPACHPCADAAAATPAGAARSERGARRRGSLHRLAVLKASEVEDLTLAQASVMVRLSAKEGVTVSDLAAEEGVRHQSMAATVSAMTETGLLKKSPDPDDGRRRLIALTAEGSRRRRGRPGPGPGGADRRARSARVRHVCRLSLRHGPAAQ